MKPTKEELKLKHKTTWAYVAFIFQTFFKRPFGYIIAALYVLYLSIILLIVPAALHLEPLFIWSNAAINMSIFNLFFIAASAGSLAVAVFRTGRDDGTELALSAKPITKNTRIFGSVFVYCAIMLGITALTVAILALIWPVFGEYDIWTNITGITWERYVGLLLSITVGNIVNMLFFGGIAVLISMVGGQVITIIGSVGIAFLMVLLNVIFPIAVSSPLSVLNDKYNTSINSMVANTRGEFNKGGDSKLKNYAAIQCITEQDGTETTHFDTYEYWTKANRESGIQATNYIDFGKQLSYLYNAFGVDQAKLDAASKLMIGLNNTNYYSIQKDTHISSEENQQLENYPLAIYSLRSKQGVSFPIVDVLAGTLDVSRNNWYAVSTLCQTDWNAVFVASREISGFGVVDGIREKLKKPWFKMSELILTNDELTKAKGMFNSVVNEVLVYENHNVYSGPYWQEDSAAWIIDRMHGDQFFEGDFEHLSGPERFNVVAKIQMAWLIFAQDEQIKWINEWKTTQSDQSIKNDKFPFSSKTVKKWYESNVKSPTGEKLEYYSKQAQIENIYNMGIYIIDYTGDNDYCWSVPQKTTLEYCETYNNLYQYKVTSFYDVNILIIIWAVIGGGLFTTAVIVYKRTDFK